MERLPLEGLRVGVTRQPDQAAELIAWLRAMGAEPVACPVLEFTEPDDLQPLQQALSELDCYQWVIFTSPNGVRRFLAALDDPARLRERHLAAIGPGTAACLEEQGLTVALVASPSVAEGLLEAFAQFSMEGQRVLLPRAQEAREVLPEGLRAQGARVDVVPVYKTVQPVATLCPERLDWVILMSSSAARGFRQLTSEDPRCLCIGPVTAATAREMGFTQIWEADHYDLAGVQAKLLELQ